MRVASAAIGQVASRFFICVFYLDIIEHLLDLFSPIHEKEGALPLILRRASTSQRETLCSPNPSVFSGWSMVCSTFPLSFEGEGDNRGEVDKQSLPLGKGKGNFE